MVAFGLQNRERSNTTMARQKTPPQQTNPKLILSPSAIRRGIERLGERISELDSFDYKTLSGGRSPELTALIASINDTLERCFGDNTTAYNRLSDATKLEHVSYFVFSGQPTPDYIKLTRNNITRAVALLKEGQRMLQEDLADFEEAEIQDPVASAVSATTNTTLSKKVFIVHGREDGLKEATARFLQTIGLEPVILHEQASGNRTVIEKIERYGDVSFAVVLLTPDDTGALKGEEPVPRARQNVLLELGYFMGRLGRANVCALRQGQVDVPTDFAGVIWIDLDPAGAWKVGLAKELKEAGHTIDWNLVMNQ